MYLCQQIRFRDFLFYYFSKKTKSHGGQHVLCRPPLRLQAACRRSLRRQSMTLYQRRDAPWCVRLYMETGLFGRTKVRPYKALSFNTL